MFNPLSGNRYLQCHSEEGLGGAAARPVPPRCTKCNNKINKIYKKSNSPSINGTVLLYSVLLLCGCSVPFKGLNLIRRCSVSGVNPLQILPTEFNPLVGYGQEYVVGTC